MTPAETIDKRERKLSTVQFSGDPFQELTGAGHRQPSISGASLGAVNVAAQRRRSSAVAPDAGTHHHSGYDGAKLATIVSKPELPPANEAGGQSLGSSSGTAVSNNGHTQFYDVTTLNHNHRRVEDRDSIGPHDMR